ncbi:Redoxin [Endogone sp. FLAS-F59071]|nr:Redoxin [Endogone sp. FLAS-F59071]|eukprot:RUS23044.1 Redoxin [Endogone sp. FLAS-F59071]
MTVKVGDKIPDVSLGYVEYDPSAGVEVCQRPASVKTHNFFKSKKVVIFAIPGAFTPTCQETHVPGFLQQYNDFKQQGYDQIICLSIIDAFVMNAFGKVLGVQDKILMVGDGNGEFSSALGLTQDLTVAGFGSLRAKRYAIVVDDLVVKYVGVESGPGVTESGADAILAAKL